MTKTFFRPQLSFDICCEECNEPVLMRIKKCPVCDKKYAETDYSGSPQMCIDDNKGLFMCHNCKSNFLLLYWNPLSNPESLVELLDK